MRGTHDMLWLLHERIHSVDFCCDLFSLSLFQHTCGKRLRGKHIPMLWGNLLGVLHRFCQFQVWCFQIVSFWAAAHTTIACLVLVCKSIHVSSIIYSALSYLHYLQCCNDDFLQSGAPKHSQTVSNIL